MHRTFTTLALAVAIGALGALAAVPLAAQDTRLTGTVAETFGGQIVLDTGRDRLLVTLPDGADDPARGARLDVTGTRSGDRVVATAVTVGAAPDSATAELPAILRDLGLTDLRSRTDDDGETYHVGRLPGGGWLRAEARGDRLIEVQTDGAPMPDALVDALLPARARGEPRLADITRLTEIDLEDDEISVEGRGANSLRIEIEFTRDGRLRTYESERDHRRSLSEPAARDRLAELGYTDIGFVDRGGRHVDAIAVNPYGETVEVRLDGAGRVARERLWQR